LPELRRSIDIVFRPAKVAVEVRGCYWHGCPEHYKLPSTNVAYWSSKVARNIARDADTERRLATAGWLLIVVWEHDDLDEMADQVLQAVRDRTAHLSGAPATSVPKKSDSHGRATGLAR
jgi:DNA mismatch endonuclease (patch repair protein)